MEFVISTITSFCADISPLQRLFQSTSFISLRNFVEETNLNSICTVFNFNHLDKWVPKEDVYLLIEILIFEYYCSQLKISHPLLDVLDLSELFLKIFFHQLILSLLQIHFVNRRKQDVLLHKKIKKRTLF